MPRGKPDAQPASLALDPNAEAIEPFQTVSPGICGEAVWAVIHANKLTVIALREEPSGGPLKLEIVDTKALP